MAKTLDEAGVKRLIQEIKGANKNLNAPIPISTENTPESMAQNVKNIADYVEKAKAAGITDVNGMAVTCIIDGNYSGVGYLYGDTTNLTICGIMLTDDAIDGKFFSIQSTGEYYYNIIISSGDGNVNSGMLDKGARNPIILTPDTTEVDEETYQKLLSDDVDVVFKKENANLCTLTYKYDSGDVWSFTFTCFSIESGAISDSYLYAYEVSITKASPHTCRIIENVNDTLDSFIDIASFLKNSTLSPVLQEIDLTGTDADRKAKLDQFETDWKALTGANTLNGARFVGRVTMENDENTFVLLNYDIDGNYSGISMTDSAETKFKKIVVSPNDGSVASIPLFSHLEAITIYTDNTPEHKQANLDNIAAYEANLQALGVDTTKSPMIPCGFQNESRGWITKSSTASGEVGHLYVGIARDENGAPYTYFMTINPTGKYSKYDAINSGYINNNFEFGVVGVQANAKSLEAITIRTGNTPEDKAANVAAIKAYVNNLKALGVDVTKGYMIPCKFPNSSAGVLSAVSNSLIVAITTNGRGELNCYEVYIGGNNPGAVYSIGGFQLKISSNLTTTSKQIVGAINEVNALAKGYSTPIELTTETAQNKTAIDARVAAFTAQGISLTNGCCIPVTYKGVYAGNISLINGDWYGLLVKNTNNPADNINIKLSADGTITEGNSAQ